jgi:phosphatidate cytidylyltransferase
LKETITRSVTGIFFIAVIILALVVHPYFYLALFTLVILGAWLEFTGMFYPGKKTAIKITGALMLAGTFVITYFIISRQWPAYFGFIPALFFLSMIIFDTLLETRIARRGVPISLTGFIYLGAGFCCLHCLAFRQGTWEAYSPSWILYTCYLIWTYDTMAYVTGRLAGKHPMWARLSPGKTWEGSIGGAFFAMILAIILSRLDDVLTLPGWIGLSLVVVIFGTAGDLFESWLKRLTGRKDSGSLLPGHGGILDRFDSLIMATPFVNIYLILIR